jgi:predicted PurR-regulated permease PerM
MDSVHSSPNNNNIHRISNSIGGATGFVGGSTTTSSGMLFNDAAKEIMARQSSYSFIIVILVVANILSALFLAIVRYNTLLFADYTSEFVYAVLLSEALFAPRQRIVKWLQTLSDESFWTPRITILQTLKDPGRLITILFTTMIIAIQSDWSLLKTLILVGWILVLICLILDSKVSYLFRLHTVLMSNESIAALCILLILAVSVVSIFGVFLYLSLRDASMALDSVTDSISEQVLHNNELRESVVNIISANTGRISTYINEQFEGSVIFGPLVKRLSLSFLQQIEKSKLSSTTTTTTTTTIPGTSSPMILDDTITMMLTSTWNTLINPQTWNWQNIVDNLSADSISKTLMKDSAQVTDVLKQTSGVIFASLLVAVSFLFALFDSVVRLLFSLTMLIFLLTSKESLSQVVIKSLRGVMTDPQDRANLEAFENELVRTFEACFILPVALSLCHGFAVLVILTSMNIIGSADIPAPFFASSLVVAITLFPFISPSLVVTIPWGTYAAMMQGKPWVSLCIVVIVTGTFWWIDDSLLSSFSRHRRGAAAAGGSGGHNNTSTSGNNNNNNRQRRQTRLNSEDDGDIVRRNAYLTGLSLFLGVTAFGLHGVVFGPLIVSFLLTSYNLTYNTARDASQRIWRQVTNSTTNTNVGSLSPSFGAVTNSNMFFGNTNRSNSNDYSNLSSWNNVTTTNNSNNGGLLGQQQQQQQPHQSKQNTTSNNSNNNGN